jgi:hypothetical protein
MRVMMCSYLGREADAASNEQYFGIPAGRRRLFSLDEIKTALNIVEKLSNRRRTSLEEFNDALGKRETFHGQVEMNALIARSRCSS